MPLARVTPEPRCRRLWAWPLPAIWLAVQENVIAVAGDAAFTNGISFEALNNIAEQTKRMIVVLNDNEWSIDRNVGAIASYFHRIVTNEHYSNLHDSARRIVERLGGKMAVEVVRRAEEAAKGLLVPSMLFEGLACKYSGPIDGHAARF